MTFVYQKALRLQRRHRGMRTRAQPGASGKGFAYCADGLFRLCKHVGPAAEGFREKAPVDACKQERSAMATKLPFLDVSL